MIEHTITYETLPSGLIIDTDARKVYDRDLHKPSAHNGCGSGFWSNIGCRLLQKFFKVPKHILDEAWYIHDCGYSVPPRLKNPLHKMIQDAFLQHNLEYILKGNSHFTRHVFSGLIHVLLVYKGSAAYNANNSFIVERYIADLSGRK